MSATGPSDVTGSLRLTTTVGSETVDHHLAFPRADYPRVSEAVRIFADQGTDVIGFAGLNSPLATNSHSLFTISGYLVDRP